jgi:hypothetical protein
MPRQVFNLKQYRMYIEQLPKKLVEYSEEINNEMAVSLKRRISYRAPVGSSPWATGSLKTGMSVRKTTPKTIFITGPQHWRFINAGVSPKKKIPVEFMEAHKGDPFNSLAGEKGVWIKNPKKFVYAAYSGGRGYVDRAIDSFNKDMPKIIERGIAKALIK